MIRPLTIYYNLTLKKKMLILLSFALCLVSIASMIAITYLMNASNQLLYRSTASVLSYSSTEIASILDTIDTSSDLIIANTTIQQELRGLLNDSENPAIRTRRIYYELLPHLFNNNYISFISIHQNDYILSTSGYHPTALPETLKSKMFQEAAEKKGKICWNTSDDHNSGVYLVRTIREIQNFSLEHLGTLVIRVDMNKILHASTSFSSAYENAVFLLFDQERLIYSSAQINDLQHFPIPVNDYEIIDFNQQKYFAVSGTINEVNWNYYCLVPYESMFRNVKTAYLICIMILLISTLIAVFLSEALIRNILKHFETLIKKMAAFDGENMDVLTAGYDYTSRMDELGMIHRRFDDMAIKISTLIKDDYIKQLLIKDAQLKALETQINPHFLYNTLESVNWRAKAIGEKKISDMVEALGHLLRATLSTGSEIIPLIKELEFTKDYLTIQQIRFEDRLQVLMDIPEELHQIAIPKLSIQPLIENAILYGLEQNTGICTILLQAQITNDKLRILVKNDGSQFADHLLEKLRNKSLKPHGMGIGLVNIDTRIKLNFGSSYGLFLYNEDEVAIAAILLPTIQHNHQKEMHHVETDYR